MPKNNEFAEVSRMAANSTLTHDTGNNQVIIEQPTKEGEQETYLTERNINLLKSMFKDEAVYIESMDTLWILRELALQRCRVDTPKGESVDENSPFYSVAKLTNNLIGALGNGWVLFSLENGIIHHDINHDRRKE